MRVSGCFPPRPFPFGPLPKPSCRGGWQSQTLDMSPCEMFVIFRCAKQNMYIPPFDQQLNRNKENLQKPESRPVTNGRQSTINNSTISNYKTSKQIKKDIRDSSKRQTPWLQSEQNQNNTDKVMVVCNSVDKRSSCGSSTKYFDFEANKKQSQPNGIFARVLSTVPADLETDGIAGDRIMVIGPYYCLTQTRRPS